VGKGTGVPVHAAQRLPRLFYGNSTAGAQTAYPSGYSFGGNTGEAATTSRSHMQATGSPAYQWAPPTMSTWGASQGPIRCLSLERSQRVQRRVRRLGRPHPLQPVQSQFTTISSSTITTSSATTSSVTSTTTAPAHLVCNQLSLLVHLCHRLHTSSAAQARAEHPAHLCLPPTCCSWPSRSSNLAVLFGSGTSKNRETDLTSEFVPLLSSRARMDVFAPSTRTVFR